MISAVYKSRKKEETYLFVERRDDFSRVPAPLLEIFGVPEFVMLLPLAKLTQLALSDINKVRAGLQERGYFLQVPPPVANLLTEHRKQLRPQAHE